ncbi:MAG: hypothetical protein V4712_17355 [Pseudomonadota bacterium]
MDVNRIVQMVLNLFIRKVVNKGVDMGIDYASRRGKPASEATPADQAQAKSSRDMVKRARQAARITRRFR